MVLALTLFASRSSVVFADPPAPAAPHLPDIEMFTQQGCPHCVKGKAFIDELKGKRPGLVVALRDVTDDTEAFARLEALAKEADIAAVATPAFYVRKAGSGGAGGEAKGRLVIGWADRESTGAYIEAVLDGKAGAAGQEEEGCPIGPATPACEGGPPVRDSVDVPLLGRVSAKEVGLPLFTAVVGLLDGFNPCAMWVLVFLLSLLASAGSRSKMLAIAGTFVAASGLVYFAFMAAWLNVFLLVGLSRGIQVALGVVAVFVGVVNVKDYFKFHEGLTLSIPESVKPGLYARVNRIVRAENLAGAMASVVVLAVLVNTVELLCTAGLPAVYTQVLTMHHLPRWQYYAYIALYQVFYMLDDTIMLGIAVVTLSRRRMQERSGRVLKLISGVVMLALGIVLALKPEWLHW